jgi:hypothetical protein
VGKFITTSNILADNEYKTADEDQMLIPDELEINCDTEFNEETDLHVGFFVTFFLKIQNHMEFSNHLVGHCHECQHRWC